MVWRDEKDFLKMQNHLNNKDTKYSRNYFVYRKTAPISVPSVTPSRLVEWSLVEWATSGGHARRCVARGF